MALPLPELFRADTFVVIVLVALGLYCVVSKGNLIKMIIGIEIMAKGAMLNFITSGYMQNNAGLAQSIVVTAIVIDVVVVAVALSLIVQAYKHYGSLSIKNLTRLKG